MSINTNKMQGIIDMVISKMGKCGILIPTGALSASALFCTLLLR